MKRACCIEDWMWEDDTITWSTTPSRQFVKATPLYNYFQKLTKQCDTFMTGASLLFNDNTTGGEEAETMVNATTLCGDIIAAKGDIDRAMKVMGVDPTTFSGSPTPSPEDASSSGVKTRGRSAQKKSSNGLSIEVDKKYTEECERLAFRHVTLSQAASASSSSQGLNYPSFNYNHNLQQSAGATRNPKDRLHLIKELAVTATSLPAGIWMRVDEVRNDAMYVCFFSFYLLSSFSRPPFFFTLRSSCKPRLFQTMFKNKRD